MQSDDGLRAIRWSEEEQRWEVMLWTGEHGELRRVWWVVGRYEELADANMHFNRLAAGKVKGF